MNIQAFFDTLGLDQSQLMNDFTNSDIFTEMSEKQLKDLNDMETLWKISKKTDSEKEKARSDYIKTLTLFSAPQLSQKNFLNQLTTAIKANNPEQVKSIFGYVILATLNQKNNTTGLLKDISNVDAPETATPINAALTAVFNDTALLEQIKNNYNENKKNSEDILKIFINAYTVINPDFINTNQQIKDIFQAVMEKEYSQLFLEKKLINDPSLIGINLREKLETYGFNITDKPELNTLNQEFLRQKNPELYNHQKPAAPQVEINTKLQESYAAGRAQRAQKRATEAALQQEEDARREAEKTARAKENQQIDDDLKNNQSTMQNQLKNMITQWNHLDSLEQALTKVNPNSPGTKTHAVGKKEIHKEVLNLKDTAIDAGFLEEKPPIMTIEQVQQKKEQLNIQIDALKKELERVKGALDAPTKHGTYTPNSATTNRKNPLQTTAITVHSPADPKTKKKI